MQGPSPDRLRETKSTHSLRDSPSDRNDRWPSQNPRTRSKSIRRRCKPNNHPRKDANSDRLPLRQAASRIRNLQRQSSFRPKDYYKSNRPILPVPSPAEEQTHQKRAKLMQSKKIS